MEHPARVAQVTMRDTSSRYSGRSRAASCPRRRSPSSARTCAPCAGTRPRSSASPSRRRSPRARRRRASALHHQIREREVVAEARVDLDVVLAPHRVDRAVAAGDGVEPRLVGSERELVAPVDAFLVATVVRLDVQPAADIRDVGIGKVARRACAARRAPRCSSRRRRRRSRADVSRTALSWAATLPPRALRITRAPAASASSSVRSVDASEVTTSSSCSAG